MHENHNVSTSNCGCIKIVMLKIIMLIYQNHNVQNYNVNHNVKISKSYYSKSSCIQIIMLMYQNRNVENYHIFKS